MESRPIYDYLGQQIGILEFPIGTPEHVWEARLAQFSQEPKISYPNITARQIRLQLVSIGVSLASVDAILDTLPEPLKSYAKIEWEYANEFERANPLTNDVAAALGMDEATLNQFWFEASQR